MQRSKQITRMTQSKPGEEILKRAVLVNKERLELISSENSIQRHTKLTIFSLLNPKKDLEVKHWMSMIWSSAPLPGGGLGVEDF